MKRKLSFILFVLCFVNITVAQDNRPGWLTNKPKASNSSFVYVVERGVGTTVNDAINDALLKVLRTTMMRIGAAVSWEEVNGALQRGDDWGTLSQKYKIPINKACEYVEKKTDRGYQVAVLCQVAKSVYEYAEFDDFSACNDTRSYSNIGAALKSAVIPGLGQMGKRRYASGIFTLLGESALLAGTVITYVYGNESKERALETGSPRDMVTRVEHYNTMRTVHIGFATAAAVFYVYNIIRAYTMSPRYKSDNLVLAPALIPTDQSLVAGVGITLNF